VQRRHFLVLTCCLLAVNLSAVLEAAGGHVALDMPCADGGLHTGDDRPADAGPDGPQCDHVAGPDMPLAAGEPVLTPPTTRQSHSPWRGAMGDPQPPLLPPPKV
jgi:hypothetical protein